MASDSITITFEGKDYVLPVEYRPIYGGDYAVPLLAEMVSAMFDMAIVKHRRSLGEVDHGTLPLSFQAENAKGNFARAWARIEALKTMK